MANFVLARFGAGPRSADAAFAFLQSRGILTRKMGAYGLPEHIRITVGLEEEMRAVVAALADFLRRGMSAPHFERVALIGIGLIGSSLARVLRRDGLAGEIVACARQPATLRRGAAARPCRRASPAMPPPPSSDADLVVLCTPLSAYAEIGRAIAPALKPGAIVSDVGSVKGAVVRELGPLLPAGVHLVPGHPVAGTEHSGPEAGLCRAVPRPLVHPDAAAGRRCRGARARRARCGARRA